MAKEINKYLISVDAKNKIRVVEVNASWSDEKRGFLITRLTGQLNGTMTYQPEIIVSTGKANRTVSEQAALQFNHIVKEYKDKGYKEIPQDPCNYKESQLREFIGEVTTNQDGIPKPMCAKQEDKVTNRKIFEKEWYASRKIDGVRVLIYCKNGKLHTASRGGGINYDNPLIEILTNPTLIQIFKENPGLIMDGEIYRHGMSLQQISGKARKQKNIDDYSILQFYWYDIVDITKSFIERQQIILNIQNKYNLQFRPNYDFEYEELRIQVVPHEKISGWNNIKQLHDKYVEEGWEGLVLRDPNKLYRPSGRTNDMIKVKMYQDAEFEITGLSEGLREEDMCFTLITLDGIEFKAKPMGSREIKEQYRNDLKKLIGKMATVKYFYLSDDGTPLQPVLKSIRDYE